MHDVLEIKLEKSNLDHISADLVVVFAAKKPATKESGKAEKGGNKKSGSKSEPKSPKENTVLLEGASKSVSAKLEAAAESGSITGATSEFVLFRDAHVGNAKHLAVIGLGELKDFDAEVLRQAVATAFTQAKTAKVKSVAFGMDTLPKVDLSAEQVLQVATEGAGLASYSFSEFKTGKKDERVATVTFVTNSKNKGHEKGLEAGRTVVECVNFSRWLGDRPGNRMTPTMLAEETEKAAKGTKLKVTVWDKSKIKSEKMGSFLSVSLGSVQDPRFIIMEYSGAGASKKPVCFVGKGLTFDSGGISIKPSAGMEEMKYDMCGGANVIGAMLAIAKLKLKVNVIGLVPATENMPGPNANKPGDIVIARNGKTIEVNNTDAEGRLILNDALVYACEQKPAAIFDAATLTGAMVVALGNIHTGFFTRNDKLASKVEAAAKAAGELVWRMPLTDFHVRDMKGTYADLSNISSGKGAGSATAAAFLEQFVEKDIPWAHFDIAGTGWHNGDRFPYNPRKGASGAMIRTFIELAQSV
jgi:leucyl aminopeptidase